MPLPLEQIVQQRAVFGGRGRGHPVVDSGVGRHHQPRAVGDEPLERGQVDLAQGSGVDLRPIRGAFGLRVIGHEMFGAHGDSTRLCRCDQGRGEFGGEQRVLGVALEMSPPTRCSLQVDLRGQDDVHPVAAGFGGDQGAGPGHQLPVPRGGEGAGRGERSGGLARHGARAADTSWPVGHHDAPQSDPRDGHGRPDVGPHHQSHLLGHGQSADQQG